MQGSDNAADPSPCIVNTSLPLTIDGVVDKKYNAKILANTGCTATGVISKELSKAHQPQRTAINPLRISTYKDDPAEIVDTIVNITIDIGGITSTITSMR